MQIIARMIVILCLGVACTTACASGPNVIFILVDDLGWGDLSCYGQEHWETPRLDRMAAEGMLFTQAYAGSTVCAPSRAALLTGNHTGKVWQRGNGTIQFRRDPEDITIATRLKLLGYQTAMIGKSGLACNSNDAKLPNDKGFDYFFGYLAHEAAHRQYPRVLYRNGEHIEYPENQGKTGETYASSLFVDDAITWIDDHKAGPFFLHLALTPPHADIVAPEKYVAPFKGRFEETPHNKGGYLHQQEPKTHYAGMIAFIDESVGRVLDRLEELGIADQTLVIFTSDNGPHYEGGINPKVFDSNGPLRGGKRDLYEGGIRVPQIAWWPGKIASGSRSDHPTAFWDFAPTAIDLAKGEKVAEMDGISIVPTLMGDTDKQERHAYLYWEFYEQGGKQAVRLGQWKGVRLNASKNSDGPIELYDLDADPGETVNLSDSYPEVVHRIQEAMSQARTPSSRFSF